MSRKKTPISGRCFPFFFHLDAGQTETRDGEAYASLRHVSDVSEATYPSVSSERRDEERVSHTREQWHPTSHTGTGDPPTAAEMSLLPEGFKTRIPRPAVAASPAPVAEEAPTAARATAAAVKSAVAAAVRPISPTVSTPSMSPNPDIQKAKTNAPRCPREIPPAHAHSTRISPKSNQSRGKGKENAPANNAAAGTKRKPMAPTVTTNAPPAAKKPNGGDTSSPMDFDPEFEELIAMKLATKDTKYDYKAQIAVAKDFSQRAKALMRTMRGTIGDVDAAVASAKAESQADLENALGEAEDASRERDSIAQSLDAARAEAQASAAQLAAAAKRESAAAKAADDNRRQLESARKSEAHLTEKSNALQTELAPLREELASVTTAHRLLQEQASGSIRAAADANEQVAKLLADKATAAEEHGRLRGELTSTVAQLESARYQAAEHEKEKARVGDEANRLHADLARTKAEKDASNEQLRVTREDVAAHARLADGWIVVRERVFDITAFATTHPVGIEPAPVLFAFSCSMHCVVLLPGDAHMSRTAWCGSTPRIAAGTIESTACLVSTPGLLYFTSHR